MPHSDNKLADTIPEAADRLSVSRTRIFGEIKAGRLRALKAGGRTLISRDAQRAWLASLPQVEA